MYADHAILSIISFYSEGVYLKTRPENYLLIVYLLYVGFYPGVLPFWFDLYQHNNRFENIKSKVAMVGY